MSWQNVVQTKRYETTEPNITALYRMESDGTATVGTSYGTLKHIGTGGSYTHSAYLKFGTCFKGLPGSDNSGYSYHNEVGGGSWASTMGWATNKSWKVWIKVDSSVASTQHYLIGFSDGGETKFRIGLQNNVWTTAEVDLVNSGSVVQIMSNPNLVNLNDGGVHCIEFVSVASNNHRLYIDGILHDSSSTTCNVAPGQYANIPADGYGAGGGPFAGWVDEISCFTTAHSAKEVYAHGGALLC